MEGLEALTKNAVTILDYSHFAYGDFLKKLTNSLRSNSVRFFENQPFVLWNNHKIDRMFFLEGFQSFRVV